MSVDEDFVKLVAFCRKNGIQTYKKTQGPVTLELEFHPASLMPESAYRRKKKEQGSELIQTDKQFSEEDALFWSSAGIPPENS